MSEALILESVNPQYDDRLFIDLLTASVQEKYKFRTCCVKNCFECQNKCKKQRKNKGRIANFRN